MLSDKWIQRLIALALGICLTFANIYITGICELGYNPSDYTSHILELKMEPESHFNYLKESIIVDSQTRLSIPVGKSFFLQEEVFLVDEFLSNVHKGDIIEYKKEKSTGHIVEVSKSGTTYLSIRHLNYKNKLTYKMIFIAIFSITQFIIILLVKLKWCD